MEIMSTAEVAKMIDLSESQLNRLRAGRYPVANLSSGLDKEFIESLGLKICQCCGVRLVPTKPIRYHVLTRLCEPCWTSEMGDDNYDLHLPVDTDFEDSFSSEMRRKDAFEDEEFKDIPGFPRYQVSNYGRVYDFFDNTYLPLHVTLNRNLMVILYKEYEYHGKHSAEHGRLVHNLVLEAFVGPCPEGHVAHHKNGVLSDNQMRKGTAENLEWIKETDAR